MISKTDAAMYIALSAAARSKDARRQVGAVLLSDDFIIGIGYNGTPRGVDDKTFTWPKSGVPLYDTKHPYVIHAEENALENARKRGFQDSIKGSTLILPYRPCPSCSKQLHQANIGHLVYLLDYSKQDDLIISKRLLEEWGGVSSEKVSLNTSSLRTILESMAGSSLDLATIFVDYDLNKSRSDYISFEQFFSAHVGFHSAVDSIDNSIICVNEENRVMEELLDSQLPSRFHPHSFAFAAFYPSGDQIDALRKKGVYQLNIIRENHATEEMYKDMKITSFSSERNQKNMSALANNLNRIIHSYTSQYL